MKEKYIKICIHCVVLNLVMCEKWIDITWLEKSVENFRTVAYKKSNNYL